MNAVVRGSPSSIPWALTEAVLTSARVPLEPDLRVFRSSEDDTRWEVRCRVVSMTDLEAFRSELPERFARHAARLRTAAQPDVGAKTDESSA